MKMKRIALPCVFIAFLFASCARQEDPEAAGNYIRKSDIYYQKAVRLYQGLISKDGQADRLRFELGRLYYGHGDFKQAVSELKSTSDSRALKFLGISYYRLGNFTDALEVFNKIEKPDEECLYYHGLTCEKLNLYDQALGLYKQMGPSSPLALERINAIERQVSHVFIRDIDPAAQAVISAAPSEDEYPQAGALILYCDEKVRVNPDNTVVSDFHYIVKVLNERGKEGFAETSIEYDSTFEKVELEYARTIKPDGSVVEIGSRHIRDVSKYLNFPLYSNARVYIISFPEVTEGASIEYKLKVYRSQMINKKDFIINYPVQAGEPIISANFTLDLPEERAVNIRTINDDYNDFGADLKPQAQTAGGRRVYRWQFKDIPQILPESSMPPSVEINPTVLISTFGDWQDVYSWWRKLSEDKMVADAAIKDKVRELTAGLGSDDDKMRAVYNFCAQEIRYVAVEYGQAGYEPHRAQDIFRNKYGDCKDQAVLLVTMLKEAGFKACLVLIPTRGYYNLNPDFPAVLFNHAIASVWVEGKPVFLDPTAETCSFGDLPADDQGRRVLLFKDDSHQIETTPLYPAMHNLIRQNLSIRVNSDETIAAKKEVFSFGGYDQIQRAWLLYTAPELIEQALREKIQGISIGATLDRYDIQNLKDLNTPAVLSYEFKGPEYFTAAGPLRIMPQVADIDTSIAAKAKRRYPVDFGVLDAKETVFKIELPAGFSVKYMPSGVSESSRWMNLDIKYAVANNSIIITQKMEFKETRVLKEEYPDFKRFFESLAKKVKQRIVLEKKNRVLEKR